MCLSRILSVLFVLFVHSLHAHEITRFFDKNFFVTDNKDSMVYAGIIKWNGVKWQGFVADDSGKKRMIGLYKDSLAQIPDGPFVYYYPNGKKKMTGSFEDGLMKGAWSEFSPAGVKTSEQIFDSSVLNGKYSRWHEDGALIAAGEYVNGRADKFNIYHRNGQIACVSLSKDDKQCYSETGRKRNIFEYWERMPEPLPGHDLYKVYEKKLVLKRSKWNVGYKMLALQFKVDEKGDLFYSGLYDKGRVQVDNSQLVQYCTEVLKEMSPWQPGYLKCRAEPIYYSLPVRFE